VPLIPFNNNQIKAEKERRAELRRAAAIQKCDQLTPEERHAVTVELGLHLLSIADQYPQVWLPQPFNEEDATSYRYLSLVGMKFMHAAHNGSVPKSIFNIQQQQKR
jgi:hypothetical protein